MTSTFQCSLSKSLHARDSDNGVWNLVKDSIQFAITIGVIYYNVWPSKLLVCEPIGFGEISVALVGMLSLSIVIPAALRSLDVEGYCILTHSGNAKQNCAQFSEVFRKFFAPFAFPFSSAVSILTAILLIQVILGKLSNWIICAVSKTPSVFTVSTFLLYGWLTIAPAFAIIASAYFADWIIQLHFTCRRRFFLSS